jgi:ribosomal-protein-alanine N-acetyltransferase
MQLSDIPTVMDIERVAFPVPWKASAYEYEIVSNRVASYQVLTAQIGDKPALIIGYGGYWRLADEAHISTIAIQPEWRGRGLGEMLLINMLLLSNRDLARIATLEVRRSNIVAQSLYKKYKFELVGERRRYYQKQEDALIMTVTSLDKQYLSFLRLKQIALFQKISQEVSSQVM